MNRPKASSLYSITGSGTRMSAGSQIRAASVAGGGEAPWDPTQIPNVLGFWSDQYTASGSNLTQWTDKSGNGRHWVPDTSTTAPTVTTSNSAINNQPSLTSGAGVRLIGSSTFATEALVSRSTGMTAFFVINWDFTGPTQNVDHLLDLNGDAGDLGGFVGFSRTIPGLQYLYGFYRGTFAGGAGANCAYYIVNVNPGDAWASVIVVAPPNLTGTPNNTMAVYYDNVSQTTALSASVTGAATGSNYLLHGNPGWTARPFLGEIAAAAIATGAASSQTLDDWAGWVGSTFGIAQSTASSFLSSPFAINIPFALNNDLPVWTKWNRRLAWGAAATAAMAAAAGAYYFFS